MRLNIKIKTLAAFLVICSLLFQWQEVRAGSLSNVLITLSNIKPSVSSNHTIRFNVGSTDTIKLIKFQYAKSVGDLTKPAGLDVTGATLSSHTGLPSTDWAIDKSAAASGVLKIASDTGDLKQSGDTVTIVFNTITNPALGDCSISGRMYDLCYLQIDTYSDNGITGIDATLESYQIEDEPSLSFIIEGVDSGVATNGITTNVTTTETTIPFGRLTFNDVTYAAHKLTVSTNAAAGYVVNMKLDGYIQGLFPANKIDPFAAVDASWASPQAWTSPTGRVANTDSGWIGANTSDTRVPDWSNASGKFGPVSSTSHEVMRSSGKDAGTSAYVTYGIEVNELQPPDSYAGTLIYQVIATY